MHEFDVTSECVYLENRRRLIKLCRPKNYMLLIILGSWIEQIIAFNIVRNMKGFKERRYKIC